MEVNKETLKKRMIKCYKLVLSDYAQVLSLSFIVDTEELVEKYVKQCDQVERIALKVELNNLKKELENV